MTLQAIGVFPYPQRQIAGGPFNFSGVANTAAFDSATDRVAYVGRAPWTDSIAKIHFRTGTVTSGPVLDCRVETVVNGRPSGTLFGTNTNGARTVAGANTWQSATLTSAASMTEGSEFAINLVYTSGTANFQLSASPTNMIGTLDYLPLTLQDTGAGTWAPLSMLWEWMIEWTSGGITFLPSITPLDGSATLTAFNTGTTPNERALKFQVPFKCAVKGITLMIANVAVGADFTCSLWPASSITDADALAQTTEDGDFETATTTDGYVTLWFASEVTLNANTVYYLGLRPATANSVSLVEFTVTAGIAGAINGFPIPTGGNCLLATRTWSGGTATGWTPTATTLPQIHLLISKLDDGAGGSSGMLYIPDMAGT